MFNQQNKTTKFMALVVAVALPASAMAGGYGDTAVRDGNVANVATNQPTVLCPRLGQRVPANLASQMDCGGSATPAVAGERVRNTGILGRIFGGHKVGSGPGAGSSDDDDGNVVRVSNTPPSGGTDPDPITPTDPSTPTDPTPPSSTTGKWDRLGELGVTPSNFNDQSDSFKDDFNDYVEENGFQGDWSGFNPD